MGVNPIIELAFKMTVRHRFKITIFIYAAILKNTQNILYFVRQTLTLFANDSALVLNFL